MSAARLSAAFLRRALFALTVGGLALTAARADEPYPWLVPLQQGRLTIWVVREDGPSQGRRAARTAANAPKPVTVPVKPMQPMGYTEQTAGSFGQDASTFGQTASEYALSASTTTPLIATKPAGTGYTEQTAGSFGQPSSDIGTAASNHGGAAGSFGTAASDAGTNAGSYGRTAGSFGNSLGTIADAANAPAEAAAAAARRQEQEQHDSVRDSLRDVLQQRFPEIALRVLLVRENDLPRRLRAAWGTEDYPDLLVGTQPQDLHGIAARFAMATKLPLGLLVEDSYRAQKPLPTLVLMADAPHVGEAHAFMVWAAEFGVRPGVVMDLSQVTRNRYDAAITARTAVERLARGGGPGELADPLFAEFPAQAGLSMTTATLRADLPVTPPGGVVRVDVEDAANRGSLAVVLLRVVRESDHAFGLAHPLVVLRRGPDRQWRVLHVSLNVSPAEAVANFRTLLEAVPRSAAEAKQAVRPVSLAGPLDGEMRPAQPDLAWANPGGMGLEVVEWQESGDGGTVWNDAHLMLVEDTGPRLKARVTATFADHAGQFRWRVWSVAANGEIALTPWRTLKIF